MDDIFPASYEVSRDRFLRDVEPLRLLWKSSTLETYPLKNHPDLSIDWLWLEPEKKENLVIVSTAQHGIEGYVGSAMLKLFVDEFAPRIHKENTGLLLIHGINPWGMKHHRKVNENGVDLNRNFMYEGAFDKGNNPKFLTLKGLLGPSYPVRAFAIENLSFVGKVLKALVMEGAASISTAALLGQYVEPKAIYYGGEEYEDHTTVVIELFHTALENYQKVIHLDQHSGYGPRYQMSITTVPQEPLSSKELSLKFNYPLVLRGDDQEFYKIDGDMCTLFYGMCQKEYPGRYVFSCAFEYGTYGGSLLQRIHSLRTMVFESQLYWHGAVNKQTKEKVRREFLELYFPTEKKWREKALSDCRQAFDGILKAYGTI